MSPEVEDFTYSCPHCLAELDTPAGGWDGWVRCRSCGRVFLPPEFDRLPHISVSRGCPATSHKSMPSAADSATAGSALSSPPFQQNGSHKPRTSGLHHRVRALPPPDADQVPRLQSRRYGDFRVLDARLLSALDAYPQEATAPGRLTWARSQVETIALDDLPVRETFAQQSSNCFHTLHLPVRNDSIPTCVH